MKKFLAAALALILTTGFAFAAQSAYEKGLAAYEEGDYPEVIKQFSIVIKENPNNAEAYTYRAIGYYYDLETGHEKAFEDLNQAIKTDPNYAKAYITRGNFYFFLNDKDKMFKDFNQAIKVDPKNAVGYHARGLGFFGESKYDKAMEDFNEAIKFNPNSWETYYDRAQLHKELGDIKNAQKDARKSCELGNCNILRLVGIDEESVKD